MITENGVLYLVQSYDERRLAIPEEAEGFQGLLFQTMLHRG